MGTFQVVLEVGDLDGQRFERVEALVDTGAAARETHLRTNDRRQEYAQA